MNTPYHLMTEKQKEDFTVELMVHLNDIINPYEARQKKGARGRIINLLNQWLLPKK